MKESKNLALDFEVENFHFGRTSVGCVDFTICSPREKFFVSVLVYDGERPDGKEVMDRANQHPSVRAQLFPEGESSVYFADKTFHPLDGLRVKVPPNRVRMVAI
jgi:hypothetical protein